MIGVIIMDRRIITISMPKDSTKEQIATVRNKYKSQYKVNIIISGTNNPDEIIKNFLKTRLEV